VPATRLSARVIARLVQAEACELNPHYRDDLRIARLTVAYAASGEAVLCSPFVLASYMILGVHPDCVWSKIQERRRALEKFSGWKLPPKKPPQAVGRSQQKLWFEKTNAARVDGSRGGNTVDLRDQTISVPMAAPSIAAAYPNSDRSGSAKARPFFKREEIQEFFETCPPELVPSPELRTVFGMWLAAEKPFGSEIQFFKAMQHYCKGAVPKYKSESTVRANIRRAEDRGVIEVAYRDRRGNCHHIWIRERSEKDRGLYRRVTTHRLSVPLLLKWRHLRAAAQPKVEPIRKPAQPMQPDPPPAKSAPVRRPAAEHAHRSTRSIGRDQRLALFNAYIKSKRPGVTHETALEAVVREFKNRFSLDDVEYALKIVGHKNGQDVTAERDPVRDVPDVPKCMNCGSRLVQNRGPGPRLVCPDCSPPS